MDDNDDARETSLLLAKMQWELYDLEYSGGIQRRQGPLSSLEFLRDYISRNKPVILTDCVNHWPATRHWSMDYLGQVLGERMLTIQTTPNGQADAIAVAKDEHGNNVECFVEPYEEKMKFDQFRDMVRNDDGLRVPYVQEQNDNLRTIFPELCTDVDIDGFSWAQEAFNQKPEAVNLWIGNHRSKTSFHKDHYENLYVVLEGSKNFTLLPPCAHHQLHFDEYLHAVYQLGPAGFLVPKITTPQHKVKWSPIELNDGRVVDGGKRWPKFASDKFPPSLKIEVQKGEVLYLPSLWYHYVEQTNRNGEEAVIAVNYWYDMCYDVKYAHQQLIERLY